MSVSVTLPPTLPLDLKMIPAIRGHCVTFPSCFLVCCKLSYSGTGAQADPRYTPAQLYELVSDVPAYVTFIPFCTESTVLTKDGRPNHAWKPGQDPFEVEAELAVGFGGLEERYISNVVGVPFERVSVSPSAPSPLLLPLEATAASCGNERAS